MCIFCAISLEVYVKFGQHTIPLAPHYKKNMHKLTSKHLLFVATVALLESSGSPLVGPVRNVKPQLYDPGMVVACC